jgi:hypothetical protein
MAGLARVVLAAYEPDLGPWDVVRHRCVEAGADPFDVMHRRCLLPAHLVIGSQRENSLDAVIDGTSRRSLTPQIRTRASRDRLAERDAQILALLDAGLTRAEAARLLDVAEVTAKRIHRERAEGYAVGADFLNLVGWLRP